MSPRARFHLRSFAKKRKKKKKKTETPFTRTQVSSNPPRLLYKREGRRKIKQTGMKLQEFN